VSLAFHTLSPPMLDALPQLSKHPVTAHDVGAQGYTLMGLVQRGLASADANGKPILYRITEAGQSVVDALNTVPQPAADYEGEIARIQRFVAHHFRIPVIEMVSERRGRAVARPRQVAMYLAKQLTTKSLPDIGRRFGNRDHSTVIHGIRKVETLIGEDPEMASHVERLMDDLVPEICNATVDKPHETAFVPFHQGA
jgi:chromosomal replication initiator protein